MHEGFTAYSENLFLDYYYGKEASADYVIGTQDNIRNDKPIIGQYDVNQEGSSDMYYKGANMLHTIRQLVDDDKKWRSILRGLNKKFYHQTVTTEEIENYISQQSGIDFSKVFDQYLRTTMIPVFEYQMDGDSLKYRYTDIVDGFEMPIRISVDGRMDWITPSAEWKSKKIKRNVNSLKADRNFYVISLRQDSK